MFTNLDDFFEIQVGCTVMNVHVIAELIGVEKDKISRVVDVKRIIDTVISMTDLRCLGEIFYQFEPAGVSGVYLLAESHISVHTWPENEYLALDIFSCGDEKKSLEALELILKLFDPREYEKKIIKRGAYAKNRVQHNGRTKKFEQIVLGAPKQD